MLVTSNCDAVCEEFSDDKVSITVTLEFSQDVLTPEYVGLERFKKYIGDTAQSTALDVFDEMVKRYKECEC